MDPIRYWFLCPSRASKKKFLLHLNNHVTPNLVGTDFFEQFNTFEYKNTSGWFILFERNAFKFNMLYYFHCNWQFSNLDTIDPKIDIFIPNLYGSLNAEWNFLFHFHLKLKFSLMQFRVRKENKVMKPVLTFVEIVGKLHLL